MQFDLFGASDDLAPNNSAPPVLEEHGAWASPETLAFNEALRRKSLINAIALLNELKTDAVLRVLLASGFTISDSSSRVALIAGVQSDIVAAARLGMTGFELRDQRGGKTLFSQVDVVSLDTLNNSHSQQELKDDGSIDASGDLRSTTSEANRDAGEHSNFDSQSVAARLARTSNFTFEEKPIFDSIGSTNELGEGRAGGSEQSDSLVQPRDLDDARNQLSSPSVDLIQVKRYTKAELNGLFVTEMTDYQLLQARDLFKDSNRASSIEKQIAKRNLSGELPITTAETKPDTASVEQTQATQNEPSKTTLKDGVGIDYVLTTDDRIGQGGLAEKYQDNLRALALVKSLEKEHRHAVGDELRTLARYVGWGGLKGVFDPANKQWGNQHKELRAMLTDSEWNAASRSQLDAFYTDPKIVKSIYGAIHKMGFTRGRVIDPSVGVGNFFGLMPEEMRKNSNLHGVELDILTSQIVSALYPSAKIAKATGFQSFNMPAGYFDLVVGNPPFGSQSISDEKGSSYSGWSIHNYFFAKSIEMLRPGGVMSMVVSHNFLDKLDPHVRQWISRRAELISGARLPKSAFKENANTEVVTDILIFKRLDNENQLGKHETPDWLETTDVQLENGKTGELATVAINNYFIKNPQNILGLNSAEGSMYRGNEYTVLPNGDLEAQLTQWVDSIPEGIYTHLERSTKQLEASAVEVPELVKEGSFFLNGAEVWVRDFDLNGERRAHQWSPSNERALERMTGMIHIRDALRNQMRLERSEASDQQIESGRRTLNRLYDSFQKRNGYVNDSINRRLFSDDTESALIQALEFDYEKPISQSYADEHGIEPRLAKAFKADIFSRRVLFPPGEVEVVQTAKDALLHSLNYTGGVDVHYMERAYGKDQKTIIEELGDLVFEDPVEGLIAADRYLSGDVKTKLTEVRKLAERDPALERNVEALEKIIPVDKLPSEIHAAIGAAWIPAQYYSAFAFEISGANAGFTNISATGQWLLNGRPPVNFTKNNSEFGTSKLGALDLLTLAMNSRAPEVKKLVNVDGSDRYVTDEEQTEAARQCAEKIRSHWDSWVWADGDRAIHLASIYNDKFNRTVERHYDGTHLTFPGMNPMMSLLKHQKNGVWRGLQDRVMLLDQVVGAGKTFECVALVMEMRRLGISKKPMLTVPNHLTLQWRSEFYRLYPGANVLAATPQDFDKENRERFFSKIVTGNWDAVIVGHSSLKKIAVPLDAEVKVISEQMNDISDAIEALKRDRGDRNIVRDMEKIKANLESKIAKLQTKGGTKDKVVDFGDLGVDSLLVDEHHEFKNLFFTTQMNRVAGLGNPAGSGKAFDLFVKIRWLQNTFGDDAPLITATGTPVSNSLAEMFTMQRYMQYNKLRANGLHVFDSWAKQYGDVQNVYEVAPSGTGYRLSQRFAKFKNLGSLMSEYRSFADVITLQDLKDQEAAQGKVFPVPKLEGGKPINVVVPRSTLQENYFGVPEISRTADGQIKFEVNVDLPTSIVKREDGKFAMQQTDEAGNTRYSRGYDTENEASYATALGAITPVMDIDPNSIIGQFENLRMLTRTTKGKINALSLTGLANKAGLDYRLIDPSAPDDPNSKVNQAIDRLLHVGKTWEADKGVQLVFCDLSVPLSAKAKMASKEKRVYVRTDNGDLVHKKGTLHTIKGADDLSYYLIATGKGTARTFSMYDPISGQLMKDGFDNKQEAHSFASHFVTQGDGVERWIDMRDQSRPIGADEIDEYKNEHGLDADGDATDLEISIADVEGATGVAGFSIYDDMKAKLIAGGVPATQIEFIHDHDTPQSKALLFKRTNAGEVRFLFGSTPKMGAGTNVQERIVAIHHIDAPYRPSDLEQREGRGIRRGNKLYERDPEGFRLTICRYATSQTYDTRRWQLLEHKAAGVEQLRNYNGANEIEDVTTEAANSADMKAAASGNPLILKETQLSNEVKKLRLLERAHIDSQYTLRARMNNKITYAKRHGPTALEQLRALQAQRDSANVLANYGGKPLHDKEQLMDAISDISGQVATFHMTKALIYRGLKFEFSQDPGGVFSTMKQPDGESKLMDSISRTGVVTRMENFCGDIEHEILKIEKWIARDTQEAHEIAGTLNKPFERAKELASAIDEHGKVQRALRKSNALAAVKPQEMSAFKAAVLEQKIKLKSWGFGDAVLQLDKEDAASVQLDVSIQDQGR